MRRDVDDELLQQWLLQIDVMNEAVKQHDEQWRKERPHHRCKTRHEYPSGEWTCACMVVSRKKDPIVIETIKYVDAANPYGWDTFKKLFGEKFGK